MMVLKPALGSKAGFFLSKTEWKFDKIIALGNFDGEIVSCNILRFND